MTDFASLLQPDRGGPAHAVHLVDKDSFEPWLKQQSAARRALVAAQRFDGKTAYQFAILPGDGANRFDVVSTVKNAHELSPWCLAKLGEALPEGGYRLADGDPGIAAFTRGCAYYRPGTMLDADHRSRSDPAPMPRTPAGTL